LVQTNLPMIQQGFDKVVAVVASIVPLIYSLINKNHGDRC
jgi:hypothetical protein